MVDIYSKEMLYVGGAEKEFVRPNLSANGTMGGNTFAVDGTSPNGTHYLYNAFDDSYLSTYYRPYSGGGNIYIYNPDALNITQITLVFISTTYTGVILEIRAGDNYYGDIYSDLSKHIEFSKNDSGTTQILSLSNTNYYKFYQLHFANSSIMRLRNVGITATYKG